MKLQSLLNHRIDPVLTTLSPQSAALYALGVGVGDRPTDPRDLQFLYERAQPFQVLPSMVNVMCHPGPWLMTPALDIAWNRLLHGEQSFEIHKPLAAEVLYQGTTQVVGVLDKGKDKGALLLLRKDIREADSGDLVSTVNSTHVLRGDGGCGSTLSDVAAPHAVPDREPDVSVLLQTLPQAALIYRLSGDFNPIHIDPTLAQGAGFERPILHGLCSLGVATRAVLRAFCDDAPGRLQSLGLRFSSPVYPGETLVTDLWQEPGHVAFRSRVLERGVTVLSNGRAVLRPAT